MKNLIHVQNKANGKRLFVEPHIYEAYKDYVDIVTEDLIIRDEVIELDKTITNNAEVVEDTVAKKSKTRGRKAK